MRIDWTEDDVAIRVRVFHQLGHVRVSRLKDWGK